MAWSFVAGTWSCGLSGTHRIHLSVPPNGGDAGGRRCAPNPGIPTTAGTGCKESAKGSRFDYTKRLLHVAEGPAQGHFTDILLREGQCRYSQEREGGR
jgi:hypothetical protein